MEFAVISSRGMNHSVKVVQSDISWKGDYTTMFAIGQCEADSEEYVCHWIPSSLLESLDKPKEREAAKVAIGDYIAGWMSVTEKK